MSDLAKRLRNIAEGPAARNPANVDDICAIAEAADEIERLRKVIRWGFGINPDTSDGTSLIGQCILPMPDDVRDTILETLAAAEAAKEK